MVRIVPLMHLIDCDPIVIPALPVTGGGKSCEVEETWVLSVLAKIRHYFIKMIEGKFFEYRCF